MPRKKKGSLVRTLLDVIAVVSFVLSIFALAYPNMFVINYMIHEKTVNLDRINAYAHPSDSVTIGDSLTATVQNNSGTYRLNDSANALIQNASGTNTRSVGLSDSVTITVQNSSGTFTFQGS